MLCSMAARSLPILFDMDGTLLSSIEAAERVWTRWAAQFGIDARTFLHVQGTATQPAAMIPK